MRRLGWMRRRSVQIVFPAAAGAVLLGGAGWFVGPAWAVAGALAGPIVGYSVLFITLYRGRPDPVRLVRKGRPEEAYRLVEEELSFNRGLAAKRPMFRDVLAHTLETMAHVLQALDDEPRALDAAAEAAAIYTELTAERPGRFESALASTRQRQATLLSRMGRHDEALAALEPAVQIYRRLAVTNRGVYLPSLAVALTRQADELGFLDRTAEARASLAEAELICTDMLPTRQS